MCRYRSSCRDKVTPVLGEMGSLGFESKSSHHTEGGLHPPLPVQTPLNKVTYCNKPLPQLSQTVLPDRGTVSADKQERSRTGTKSKLTGFLQLAIFGTQTQQPVETGPGPEHLEHLFEHRVVQDGDPRDIREFKIQVHVVTRTAKRTDDVILDVFSKLRTSSYKFTTCKTSSTSKDKT